MTAFLIIMAVFFVCVLIGVPVAFSIGAAALAGVFMGDISFAYVAHITWTGINGFVYIAIAMFVLAGNIMGDGGLSRRIVDFAKSLVGRIHGGLSIVTTIACAFFAALSGSSPATAAAIGSMMIPEMKRNGYDPEDGGAVVAASGTLGIMIPPSTPMIIYSVTAGVSVADMFIGGIVPGILLAFGLCLVGYMKGRKKHYISDEPISLKRIAETFWEGKWSLVAPIVVLGGIYGGFVTVTEASVLLVVYSIIVSVFIHKKIKFKDLPRLFWMSAKTTAGILLIMSFATAFARLLTINRIPDMIGAFVLSVTSNPFIIMLLFAILIIITGCFIESIAQILIYTPLFLPILRNMGIDPVQFGILIIVGTEIGLLTPPVGVNLFVVQGLSGVRIEKLAISVLPFMLSMILVFILLILFPQFSTWLPNLAH